MDIVAYDSIVNECRKVFLKKLNEYGSSWKILRFITLVDLIANKVRRIKTVQETKTNKVGESIHDDIIGIFNYCAIYIIVSNHKNDEVILIPFDEASALYEEAIRYIRNQIDTALFNLEKDTVWNLLFDNIEYLRKNLMTIPDPRTYVSKIAVLANIYLHKCIHE